MDIFVYLDRMVPDLERSLQANSLALGCTPIVNLFEQRCEPISLDHTRIEYRIEPDARRPASLEIWSVERVRESLPGGEFRPWSPFHRLTRTHGADAAEQKVGGFYGIARRDIVGGIGGTDVLLLPHDAAFDPEQDGGGVLAIDVLCCNRDLPASLPFGGGRPTLRLIEGAAAVTGFMCLTAPTPTLRLPLQDVAHGAHLTSLLGHLSVVGAEADADACAKCCGSMIAASPANRAHAIRAPDQRVELRRARAFPD
jgi:type VI secretion system protein ImpG